MTEPTEADIRETLEDYRRAEREGEVIHFPYVGLEIYLAHAGFLAAELDRVRAMVPGLCDRIAAQSELLSRRAEK